jgi:hypothetical protein
MQGIIMQAQRQKYKQALDELCTRPVDVLLKEVDTSESEDEGIINIPDPKQVQEARNASVRQKTIDAVQAIGEVIHKFPYVYGAPKSILLVCESYAKTSIHGIDIDLAEDLFLQSGWIFREITCGEMRGSFAITSIDNKSTMDSYINSLELGEKLRAGAAALLVFSAFSLFLYDMASKIMQGA